MLETKKQHYLPFAYLKFFRTPDSYAARKHAKIFCDNGDKVWEAKAGKQCYRHWFYRRNNTRQSELGFQSFENDWAECLDNLRAGRLEDSLLLFQILMYHFRNISIQHLTEMDRFDAVSFACSNWIEQKVLKLPKGVKFTGDPKHVTEFPWIVRLISFSTPLLTSDNPSVLSINPERDGSYAPFFLPVSPTELLVAIDPTGIRVCFFYR